MKSKPQQNQRVSATIADSATTEDLLEFEQFATPIAERVAAASDESTPMTIGVYGEWGSGKTSFLMMVDSSLRKKGIYPIWFNAWKYDQEENLWAALLQTILNQAKINGNWHQRAWTRFKIWFDSISIRSGAWELAKKTVPIIARALVVTLCLVIIFGWSSQELVAFLEKSFPWLISETPLISPSAQANIIKAFTALFGVIASKPDAWVKFLDPKLGIDFTKLSRKRTYRERIAFLDEFSSEFQQIVKLVGRGKPLVVIIDDLDRCLPEKALQVLEAIKLFLDVKRCVFLLAVDREVVEKAVAVKYKDLLSMPQNSQAQSQGLATFLGVNYFDKIIHLSVPVPPLSGAQVREFITQLYTDDDVKACAKIFEAGLPRNPRKIKRILQNFLFLRDLALESPSASEIKATLLAKLVVIQNQFRDVYGEIIRYPVLLEELEKYCKKKKDAQGHGETTVEPDVDNVTLRALVETYGNKDLMLQDVLLERVSDEDTFIGANVYDYVFILRTVSEDRELRPITKEPSTAFEPSISANKDFFISYHNADRVWAEWIAWKLEEAGYTTVIQAWDFLPGSNFVLEMQKANYQAKTIIALLSKSYLESTYTTPEWSAAFAQDPTGEKRILLPIRIEECELKGLLQSIVYIDLVGLNEQAATSTLLSAVRSSRAKPSTAPSFPTGSRMATTRAPNYPSGVS